MSEPAKKLEASQYQCAMCDGIFQFTGHDAKAELKKMFPGCPVEECEIICDDCFNNAPVGYWSEHWKRLSPGEQKKFNEGDT